jgi:hypothetical protein
MVSCALPQPAGHVQNNSCERAATVKSGVRKPQRTADLCADQCLLLIKVKRPSPAGKECHTTPASGGSELRDGETGLPEACDD